MEKKICAYLFVFTFIALSGVVHGQPDSIQRGPSVEPIVEVDIEDAKKVESGFDFAKQEPKVTAKRIPANIVAKAQATTPGSYLGPFIFLIALPFAVWIMVSKKFSAKKSDKVVDYYPKTHQFKPYQTDYQHTTEDDDDIDFPKAS